ncbi:hypothetical protein ACH5RR_013093, partial [Cinchona calisaya]
MAREDQTNTTSLRRKGFSETQDVKTAMKDIAPPGNNVKWHKLLWVKDMCLGTLLSFALSTCISAPVYELRKARNEAVFRQTVLNASGITQKIVEDVRLTTAAWERITRTRGMWELA